MMSSDRTLFNLCQGSLVLLACALVGCAMPSSSRQAATQEAQPTGRTMVVIEGPRITPRSLAGIDVINAHGSVFVKVDPTLHRPTVEAIPSRPGARSPRDRRALQDQIQLSARTIIRDHRMVLLVRAEPDDDSTRIDLHIRMPSCGGAIIKTAGGVVELVGVSGELNIEVGGDGRAGGDVRVRTEGPIPGPVRIQTSNGDITLYLSPQASGLMNLTADHGSVSFYSRGGHATGVRASSAAWSGVINKGINDFRVHTENGSILVRIADYPWERESSFQWSGRVGM